MDALTIAERLARTRAGIPSSVTLVAVSKGHPESAIREAYAAGQRDFGESYAQEWRRKADALTDLEDLVWHFIGNVQQNKVKYLAGRIRWLHTLDRRELAAELSRRHPSGVAPVRAFIEVNIAGESQKHGVAPGDVAALLEAISASPGIEPCGLMCVPPEDGDPRPHFARLRELRDRVAPRLPGLSMGMSGDYLIAIEEGATIVRVGTAIFGERPARKTD